MTTHRSPWGVEIREPDGQLDEVCAFDYSGYDDGYKPLKVMREQDAGFHLERMSTRHVWMKIGDVAINVWVEKRGLHLKMRAEIEPEALLTRRQITARRKKWAKMTSDLAERIKNAVKQNDRLF
ncbi:MAG: hypothetical protein ACLQU2_03210 [Candidatus Binataceae bacterium]